ncbi:hypothetical protein PF010_g11790 [Phytophthora fragariae]|uniref:HAT C-terminal dimerisation domain-containing protein n=1 Tax=Phytophthora fragariae TaxID=53985 RepID=A0A6G0L5J8_9STRA|nr:hypothetical protein PF010_g11790 [Phytophthora fragariae]
MAKASSTSSVIEEPLETNQGVDESVPGLISETRAQNEEIPQASPQEQQASLAAMDKFVSSILTENEAAKDALAQVRSIVQRFRALSTYFHKSAKATNRLDEIQVKVWMRSALHLITDCHTRWNSCYDMLIRLIELEAPLGDFFARLGRPDEKKEFKELAQDKLPTPKEWFAIKCLVAILEPIAAVTKTLEGCSYPTLALAFPMLRRIKKVLGDANIFAKQAVLAGRQDFQAETLALMQKVRDAILELFKQRFTGMSFDLV